MNYLPNMDLSIIICYYNGDQSIEKAIESVTNLIKYSNLNLECIVIENGRTVPKKVSEKYSLYQGVHLFKIEQNKGLGKARNLGFQKAAGKYVMYIDDDAYIPEESYHIIEERIIKEDFDFGGGLIKNSNHKVVLSQFYHNYYFEPLQLRYKQIIGTNMLFRKSALNEIGGFNLNLNRADEEFVINKLLLKGKSGFFEKEMIVYHNQPKSIQHIVKIFTNNGFYRRELYSNDYTSKGYFRRLIHYNLIVGTCLIFINSKLIIPIFGLRLLYSRSFQIFPLLKLYEYPSAFFLNLIRCYLEDYGWIKHFIRRL
jgi:glycosyltransferase involved in cell wall biosynthesis